MERKVMEYFQSAPVPDGKKGRAHRAGMCLCRANIETMEELSALCERGPEKLLDIRDIGEKNAALILEICAMYNNEKNGRNEHEHK